MASRAVVELDHHSQGYLDHRLETWRELRRCPVAYSEAHGGFWVVSGYEAVARVSRDEETFSSVFRRGYTVVWCGWIGELLPGNNRLLLRAPVATQDGKPIRGVVRYEMTTDEPAQTMPLSRREGHGSYPPNCGKASAPLHLWLDNVACPRSQDCSESFHVILQISNGNLYRIDARAQFCIHVLRPSILQRIFKPLDIAIARTLRQSRLEFNIPGKITVHHQLHCVAKRRPAAFEAFLHLHQACTTVCDAPGRCNFYT